MFMTTAPALEGRTYRTLRVLVGGCYPFSGPSISGIENAYQYALSQIEYQAAFWDANAVIGVRTIKADQFYVLVAGTAIVVDNAQYSLPPAVKDEGLSQSGMWDFVEQWTRDL